jgi:transcription initiation factor TFIID TATA-box-binding protein
MHPIYKQVKMAKDVMKVKVENIVSSITLGINIDLEKLTKTVSGIDNPKRFPGVIYRLTDPKLSMLIFRTGKVICSGARSKADIERAVEQLLAKLKEGKITVKDKPIVQIQNIVASASLNFRVNLDQLAMDCEDTEYEPEQFPGLIFRLAEPKTVMLIFKSGKMIVTGAKTVQQANAAAKKTREMLQEINAAIDA